MSRHLHGAVVATLLAGVALLLAACGALPGLRAEAPAEGLTEARRLQARAAWERALIHMEERKPSLALVAAREAVTIDPSHREYRNTLGLLYLETGLLAEALTEFDAAVKSDSGFAEGHLHRGVALAEAGRWKEAVAAYQRALAIPALRTPEIARQNLGLALLHLGQLEEAQESLVLALRLDPELQAAYYHLGLVLVAQGRHGDARGAFEQALKLGPTTPFGEAAGLRIGELGARR